MRCVFILLCLCQTHCSYTLPVYNMTCHSSALRLFTLMLLLKYAFRKEPTDIVDLFQLSRSRTPSFFFPLWIQLRGNSFLSNSRKAFCFAVYCQCAPLIQKYWRIFLKEKSGNYLSIRSTSVVSSAEVRGFSAEHNICMHCNSETPAAGSSCKSCK